MWRSKEGRKEELRKEVQFGKLYKKIELIKDYKGDEEATDKDFVVCLFLCLELTN